MRRLAVLMITCVICLIMSPLRVRSSTVDDILNQDVITDFESTIINEGVTDTDVGALILKVIKGEYGLTPTPIIQNVTKALFHELYALFGFLAQLVALSLVGAIFHALSSSFNKKSVSELGVLITYIISASILLKSFADCVSVLNGLLSSVRNISESAVPAAVTIMAASGRLPTTVGIILAASAFIGDVCANVIIPVMFGGAALTMVNVLTDKDLLSDMAGLVRKGVCWGVGVVCSLFMAVSFINGIAAPTLNSLTAKTARFAAAAVPVVGSALSGAVDTIMYMSTSLRGGFLTVLIIILITVCAPPIIKLAAFGVAYKVTAALLSPVCDERITDAIEDMGGFAFALLAVGCFVSFMFICLSVSALRW